MGKMFFFRSNKLFGPKKFLVNENIILVRFKGFIYVM